MAAHEEAAERFAAAVEANERLGLPLFAARTRIEWARSLLTGGGDADPARGSCSTKRSRRPASSRSPSTERQAEELLDYEGSAASPSSTEITGR